MTALELNTQPIRVQRSRRHKQVSPNGYPVVYVGRPTKWGNPFKVVGEPGHYFVLNGEELQVTFDKEEDAIKCCVDCYREYISHEHNAKRLNAFELKGKNLSCWCKPGEPCHADVLLEIANS